MKRLRPHWRKSTWALIVWSALMAYWLIGYSVQGCHESGQAAQSGCEAGTTIGVFMILVVAGLGFIVLSLIWLMSRKKV
jgi:hypothetical protein